MTDIITIVESPSSTMDTPEIEPMTPQSGHISEAPFDPPIPPKLKKRHQLLKGLQRMGSSQSLGKLGRVKSNEYKQNNKASMSCISLGSPPSSYALSPPPSFASQFSNGFSTAPTTPYSPSPASETCYFDSKARCRIVERDVFGDVVTPMSIALPADLRPGSKGLPLTEVAEIAMERRPDFNFWLDLPHEIRVQIFQYCSPKEIMRMSRVSKTWYEMCFDGPLWADLDCQTYYQDITSDALIKIMLRAGAFVKNLNLRGCVQLKDQWLSMGTRMTNQECRNLESFSLEGCRIERSSIHFFLQRNPKLLNINLPSMQNVGNVTLKIIASKCQRVELLNIDWCSQVDQKGLLKVVQGCPNLRDLRASEVRGFDDLELMQEIFQRNSLERLILQHCESLNDESLKVMLMGQDPELDPLTDVPLVPPRRLRHLDMTKCKNVTDRGIQALAHITPHLEGLRASQNIALTDDAFSTLLKTVPRLTHLELEELENLTNATLQTLASSLAATRLEHLSISYCENVGDIGVLPVLKACPNIHSLCLDNTRISDLVLIEASEQVRKRGSTQSKNLRPRKGLELVAFDCANVTWAGVREIMQGNCRVLQGRRKSVIQAIPALPPPPQPIVSQITFHTAVTQSCEASPTVVAPSADEDAIVAFPSLPLPSPAQETPATDIMTVEDANTAAAPSSSTSPSRSPTRDLRVRLTTIPTFLYPTQIIHLKAFYGWQQTVEEHYKRCASSRWAAAGRLEDKWAEWMVASEEVGNTGGAQGGGWGSRRRRRRAREAESRVRTDEAGGEHAEGTSEGDTENEGSGPEVAGGARSASRGGRRRARSGGCAVM